MLARSCDFGVEEPLSARSAATRAVHERMNEAAAAELFAAASPFGTPAPSPGVSPAPSPPGSFRGPAAGKPYSREGVQRSGGSERGREQEDDGNNDGDDDTPAVLAPVDDTPVPTTQRPSRPSFGADTLAVALAAAGQRRPSTPLAEIVCPAGSHISSAALTAFYARVDASKIAHVHTILAQYSTEELLAALTARYGAAARLPQPVVMSEAEAVRLSPVSARDAALACMLQLYGVLLLLLLLLQLLLFFALSLPGQ